MASTSAHSEYEMSSPGESTACSSSSDKQPSCLIMSGAQSSFQMRYASVASCGATVTKIRRAMGMPQPTHGRCQVHGASLRQLASGENLVLHTRICDLLGIRHPIVLGGMGGGATNPELVAEVTNAGGLGIMSATHQPVDQQRAQVQRLRELTSGKPFG